MDKQKKSKFDNVNKKYHHLLDFIKRNNSDITFGVVFSKEEGRKHRLWCGTEVKPKFRISLKNQSN